MTVARLIAFLNHRFRQRINFRCRSPGFVVASWPARKNVGSNPFQSTLSNSLADSGLTVREFHPLVTAYGRASVWHWHWPENQVAGSNRLIVILRSVLLLYNLLIAKFRRIPVVLTVHNVIPHRPPVGRLAEYTLHKVRASASGYHFLSSASQDQFSVHYPALLTKPSVVAKHPGYDFEGSSLTPRSEARRILGIQDAQRVILFFGRIDDYKGVPDIIPAIDASRLHLRYLVVGSVDAKCTYASDLRAAALARRDISLFDRFVPDAELQLYIRACDIVSLPYRQISNSGSVLYALSLGRVVLVPNLGVMPEIQADAGTDWVCIYSGAVAPRDIRSALVCSSKHEDSDRPDLKEYSWPLLVAAIQKLYKEVCSAENMPLRSLGHIRVTR